MNVKWIVKDIVKLGARKLGVGVEKRNCNFEIDVIAKWVSNGWFTVVVIWEIDCVSFMTKLMK